jgi:hypothetical protein
VKRLRIYEGFVGVSECGAEVCSPRRKPTSVAALALSLFAIAFLSGCAAVSGTPKISTGPATISVTPSSISFGSVAIGSTASHSVTILNGGGSNLTVTQASATAAGVTISGISLPLTIVPGNQSTFTVVFSPKAAGALSGNVSILSDLSSSPNTVSLSGTAIAATVLLTASTSSLSFGNVAVGSNSTKPVVLTNSGNSDVTISGVSISGAGYAAAGIQSGQILHSGQSATLNVTFTPSAISSSYPGSVSVASNATNSPAAITLSGSGVQAVSHSVSLSWTPSTSVVAGYNVYRSQISGGPYSKLTPSIVAANAYTDSNVQSGQTYYYVATSVTSTGVESADSTQTSATIP